MTTIKTTRDNGEIENVDSKQFIDKYEDENVVMTDQNGQSVEVPASEVQKKTTEGYTVKQSAVAQEGQVKEADVPQAAAPTQTEAQTQTQAPVQTESVKQGGLYSPEQLAVDIAAAGDDMKKEDVLGPVDWDKVYAQAKWGTAEQQERQEKDWQDTKAYNQEMAATSEALHAMYYDIREEMEDEGYNYLKNKAENFYRIMTGPAGVMQRFVDRDRAVDAATKNMMADIDQMMDAGKDRNGLVDMIVGVVEGATNADTYSFGTIGLEDMMTLATAYEKSLNGTSTPEDERLLKVAALRGSLEQYHDASVSREAGRFAGEMIPFMVTMNAGGGLMRAAGAETKQIVYQMLKKYGNKEVMAKIGSTVAGMAAEGAVGTITFNAAGTTRDAMQRNMGQAQMNEMGQVRFEGGEDMTTAAGKAVGASMIMFGALSESKTYGNLISKFTEKMIDKDARLVPEVLKKGAGLVSVRNVMQAVNENSQWVKGFAENAHWNGPHGMVAAFKLSETLNALTVGDYDLTTGEKGVFNLDKNLQLVLGIGLTEGVMTGAKISEYSKNVQEVNKRIFRPSLQTLRNQFPTEWLEIKQELDGCGTVSDFEDVGERIMDRMREKGVRLTAGQKAAIRAYAHASAVRTGMKIGMSKMADRNEGMQGMYAREYMAGYNNIGQAGLAYDAAVSTMEDAFGQQAQTVMEQIAEYGDRTLDAIRKTKGATQEQIDAAEQYVKASRRKRGALDRIEDAVEMRVLVEQQQIDKISTRKDISQEVAGEKVKAGEVVKVRLSDGREVYVRGELKSTGKLMVQDTEGHRPEYVTTNEVEEIVSHESADALRKTIDQAAGRQTRNDLMDILEGTERIEPGQKIDVNGAELTVLTVDQAGNVTVTGDGGRTSQTVPLGNVRAYRRQQAVDEFVKEQTELLKVKTMTSAILSGDKPEGPELRPMEAETVQEPEKKEAQPESNPKSKAEEAMDQFRKAVEAINATEPGSREEEAAEREADRSFRQWTKVMTADELEQMDQTGMDETMKAIVQEEKARKRAEEASAMKKIPVGKDGKADWTAAPDTEVAYEAMVEQHLGDANMARRTMMHAKETSAKKLKALEEQEPELTDDVNENIQRQADHLRQVEKAREEARFFAELADYADKREFSEKPTDQRLQEIQAAEKQTVNEMSEALKDEKAGLKRDAWTAAALDSETADAIDRWAKANDIVVAFADEFGQAAQGKNDNARVVILEKGNAKLTGILTHESIHALRRTNQKAYDALVEMMKSSKVGDMSWDDIWKERKKVYAKVYDKMSPEEFSKAIDEETVTKMAEETFKNWSAFRELLEKVESKPGIVDVFRNAIQKVKDIIPFMEKNEQTTLDKFGEWYQQRAQERQQLRSQMDEEGDAEEKLSVRKKEDPKNTIKAYKMMRREDDGELYPLYIGSSEPVKQQTWYDADAPDFETMKKMPAGIHLMNMETGESISYDEFYAEHPDMFGKGQTKYPSVEAINYATDNGLRWVSIKDTENAQKRYGGETRQYYNLGINGSGAVSEFAMRPGWHAGSHPVMRQIGKGKEKNLRDDKHVWTEVELAADVDYNDEAQQNPDKDLPGKMPTDGFYLKATNADKKKSQADNMGWYVSGAMKVNRILSDAEAREVIDEWNMLHPDKKLDYDYERESGKVFDGENLVEKETFRPVGKGEFGDVYDQFKGKPEAAARFLIGNQTGDALAVFNRKGFGDIDLVWGEPGGGLEHLILKHVGEGKSFANVKEAMETIDDIIKTGKTSGNITPDKVVFRLGSKLVTIRRNIRQNGKKIADKNWILTAYDENAADDRISAITTVNKGQAARTTANSRGKVSNKIVNSQGKGEKFALKDEEREKARIVSEEYDEQLEAYKRNELKHPLSFGKPMGVLRYVGLPSGEEMTMNLHDLASHLRKHNLSVDDIKGLPLALAEPIMVYEWGSKAKSMIVITDIPRGDQRITAAVKLERNGQRLEVNEIASVHGKDVERVLTEMNTTLTDFKRDNLKYVDKEKAAQWLGIAPPKGVSSLTAEQQHAANVINNFINPNFGEEKSVVNSQGKGEKFALKDEDYNAAIEEGDTEKLNSIVRKALPENFLDIIKAGVDRYSERKASEDAMIGDAVREYVKRSIADGKMDAKTASEILQNHGISAEGIGNGERLSVKDDEDNVFVTNAKARSLSNMFRTWALDEMYPEVREYLEERTNLYEGIGETDEDIMAYMDGLSEDEYNRVKNIFRGLQLPSYNEFKNDRDYAEGFADDYRTSAKAIAEKKLEDPEWLKENAPELVSAVKFNAGEGESESHIRKGLGLDDEAGVSSGSVDIDVERLAGESERLSLKESKGAFVRQENEDMFKFSEELSEEEQKENTDKLRVQMDKFNAAPFDKYNSVSGINVEEEYRKIGQKTNKDDGVTVDFVVGTLGKIITHNGYDVSKIIPSLGGMFENSICLFSEREVKKEGHKEHPNFEGYHQYVAKANIDGKDYLVRFTVQERKVNKGKKKPEGFTPYEFHNSYISEIEITNAESTPIKPAGNNRPMGNANGIADAKLSKFFEFANKTLENNKENLSIEDKANRVESLDDVKDEQIKARLESGQRVKGWYDKNSSRVNLYTPNIKDEQDAERTIVTETVKAVGLKGLTGDEGYAKMMDDVYEHMGEDVRTLVTDLMDEGLTKEDAVARVMSDIASGKSTVQDAESLWAAADIALKEHAQNPVGAEMLDGETRYIAWANGRESEGTVADASSDIMMRKNNSVGEYDTAERLSAKEDKKRYSEIVNSGVPVNLTSFVIRELLGGTKIKWGDTEAGTRGFGKHLGYGKEERRKLFWYINEKTGLTPEQFGEYLSEIYSTETGQEMDSIEATNEVLAVMAELQNADQLREWYLSMNDFDAIEAEEAERRQREYEEEQRLKAGHFRDEEEEQAYLEMVDERNMRRSESQDKAEAWRQRQEEIERKRQEAIEYYRSRPRKDDTGLFWKPEENEDKPRRKAGESEQSFMARQRDWEEKMRLREEAENDPMPQEPVYTEGMDYTAAYEEYQKAYDEWAERQSQREERLRILEAGEPGDVTIEEALSEIKRPIEGDELRRTVRGEIRERRRMIEVDNFNVEAWVHDLKKRLTPEQLKALPFLMEETLDGEPLQLTTKYMDIIDSLGLEDVEKRALRNLVRGKGESNMIWTGNESTRNELGIFRNSLTQSEREKLDKYIADGTAWSMMDFTPQTKEGMAVKGKYLNRTWTSDEGRGAVLTDRVLDFYRDKMGEVLLNNDVMRQLGVLLNPDKVEIEMTPELQDALREIRDWFDQKYQDMDAEGMFEGQNKGRHRQQYVTHIWDFDKSDKKAVETYLASMRTSSPYTNKRDIETIREGLEMGLKPKYDDITGIITEYGHYANEAIANRKLIKFLEGLEIQGKPAIVKADERDPDYSDMNNMALMGRKVHKALVPLLDVVFGGRKPSASPAFRKAGEIYDKWSGIIKQMNLSYSLFHAMALTETNVGIMGFGGTGKAILRDMIWKAAIKGRGDVPAFNDTEATKDAVKHFVKLGATNDYAANSQERYVEKIYNWLKEHNVYGVDLAAYGIDKANSFLDSMLWDHLHDGYKLYSFAHLAKRIRARAEKEGWDQERTERALDEAGQFVNDTFGGQHWDILNVSPSMEKWMRRFLLSPDWTISTTRQALSVIGLGTLYNDDGFWHGLSNKSGNKDVKAIRRNMGAKFWIKSMLLWTLMYNGLNAWNRKKDEDYWKEEAERRRKEDPEYKSPYELAYPDGMKWWDYTMLGNSGDKTRLFFGRDSQGRELYARWGKQFREMPELFYGHEGFSVPGAAMTKMAGKVNPLANTLVTLTSGHSLSGFESPLMKDKKGLKRDLGRLAVLAAAHLPFSIPTDDEKEFQWVDLMMPTGRGYSAYKAQNAFRSAILSDDADMLEAVYKSCVMNGIDPDAQLKIAMQQVEQEVKKEQMDGVKDLEDARKQFDTETNVVRKRQLEKVIKKQMLGQNMKPTEKEQFIQNATDFIKGKTTDEKASMFYDKLKSYADLMEDERLRLARLKAKKGYEKYTEQMDEYGHVPAETARKYRKDYDVYSIIEDYMTDIRAAKSDLKEASSKEEQQELMKEIRELRLELMKQLGDLRK